MNNEVTTKIVMSYKSNELASHDLTIKGSNSTVLDCLSPLILSTLFRKILHSRYTEEDNM